jgi:hypothetical protein
VQIEFLGGWTFSNGLLEVTPAVGLGVRVPWVLDQNGFSVAESQSIDFAASVTGRLRAGKYFGVFVNGTIHAGPQGAVTDLGEPTMGGLSGRLSLGATLFF